MASCWLSSAGRASSVECGLKQPCRQLGCLSMAASSLPGCPHHLLKPVAKLSLPACPSLLPIKQETAVTMVGMVVGMAFIRLASGSQLLIWAAFWLLTAVHVWANVRAMRCLCIHSLNQARLGLLLRHYLATVSTLWWCAMLRCAALAWACCCATTWPR